MNRMSETIETLWATIEDRKRNAPPGSYTASLFTAGLPRIAQKVGEEAVETAIAAITQSDDRVIAEMADLVYHCLVLLSARGLQWSEVEAELAQRFK
jgi:phosphoribosyl-ATP pyrophosphohydrolase/phosphoribosyl-AMP cyclohydrolase